MPDIEAIARDMKGRNRPRAYRDLQGNAWEWDDERHCFVMEATEEATPTTTPKGSSPVALVEGMIKALMVAAVPAASDESAAKPEP